MKKEDDLISNNNNIIGQKIMIFLETKGNMHLFKSFLAYKLRLDEGRSIVGLDFAKEDFKDVYEIMKYCLKQFLWFFNSYFYSC